MPQPEKIFKSKNFRGNVWNNEKGVTLQITKIVGKKLHGVEFKVFEIGNLEVLLNELKSYIFLQKRNKHSKFFYKKGIKHGKL